MYSYFCSFCKPTIFGATSEWDAMSNLKVSNSLNIWELWVPIPWISENFGFQFLEYLRTLKCPTYITGQVLISSQLIMGFGLPILVQDQSLTMGTVVKFLYSVPTNASVYLDSAFNRERRNVPKTSRWEIYSLLEATCNRYMDTYKRRTNPGIQSFPTAFIHCICCMN
jgi:hypothetical protein